MRFSLFTAHDRTLADAREVWRLAEDVGFDMVGVVDSPLLMREAFVSLAALASDTTRIRIFPSVLNTLTRDPTVTAGAYLALRDLAGPRAFLAFGAGDSSTQGTGLGTASLDHMAEYIGAVRALVSGGEATYQGRVLRGAWYGWDGEAPDIYMSAHGPRALRAAGAVADGVICGFGVLPETVQHAEALIREGARDAGRDPGSVEIWHVVYYCPASTREEGFVHSNGAGAPVMARGGLGGKLVPPQLWDAVEQVAATWRLERHARPNADSARVASETGSLDYLIERAGGMIGPCDIAAQLARLHESGVRNVHFVALGTDRRTLVQSLGEAIAASGARDWR